MSYSNIQKRVLLVMSSLDTMGISGKQSGTWFTELAAPYYILTEAGYEVVFATPDGGEAPIDLLSMKPPFTTEYTERFSKDDVALYAARNTRKLRDIDYAGYDALFIPGAPCAARGQVGAITDQSGMKQDSGVSVCCAWIRRNA